MTTTVDTKEAARFTGLAAGTLENLRVTGNGPRFLKLGRAVRYRAADLDAWLDARARSSTSDASAA